MGMRLYNKRDTILVVGGMLMCHILAFGLVSFFIYRFFYLSYDPDVILLLVILIGGLVLCDVLLYRIQGISRFLIRCKFDSVGIHCAKLGLKRWTISWDRIQTYGTIGFNYSYGIIFLSTKRYNFRKESELATISENQIVFQASSENWEIAKEFMPFDISKNIQKSLDIQENRFFTRKISEVKK